MYFGRKYTGENTMLLNYGPSWEEYWEAEEEYFTADDLDRCPLCGRKLRNSHCEWCEEEEV